MWLTESQLPSLKAISFLEASATTLTDDYGIAIVAYALALANTPKALLLLEFLKNSASVTGDGTSMHWGTTFGRPENLMNICCYCPGYITTHDIETTSYALLAFLTFYPRKIQ
jgi:hypothetical protein